MTSSCALVRETRSPSASSSSPTAPSCSSTVTGSSVLCRTPRTGSRRRSWRRGEGSTASRAGVGALLAVPDRDQPPPQRATRQRTPPEGGSADGRAPPTDTTDRAHLAGAVPRRAAEGLAEASPGPGGSIRDQGDDRAGVRGGAPAPSSPPAGRARAARRARLSNGRGRGHARRHRGLYEGRPAAGARHARITHPGRGPGPRPPAELGERTGAGAPVRRDAAEHGDTDGVVSLLSDEA